MAEMWYYTTEGKQMDPVTMRELKRLVGDGTLKPTDMVWKEGMARWIRASSVKELFPDPIAALDHYFTSTQQAEQKNGTTTSVSTASVGAASASAPAAGKKGAPPAAEAEEDDKPKKKRRPSKEDDDDGDTRRPPRRRAETSSGGGSSIGIIIGVVVLVLVLLVGCGGGFAILLMVGLSKGDPVNGQINYTAFVGPNGTDARVFAFRKGVDYELTVKSQPRHPDVDLYVINPATGHTVIADTTVGPDSMIRWTPNEDGDFRVEVRNLNNVTRVTSEVQIREVAQAPPPPPKDRKDQVKDGVGPAPLPPGVKEGKGFEDVPTVPAGGERVYKYRVRAGHRANIRVVPSSAKPAINFNVYVYRDADNAQIAADEGPARDATVDFTTKATEIIRVRVVNASPPGLNSSKAKLSFDVSP